MKSSELTGLKSLPTSCRICSVISRVHKYWTASKAKLGKRETEDVRAQTTSDRMEQMGCYQPGFRPASTRRLRVTGNPTQN